MRSVADLGLARVTESGVVFMTGRPVTFRYVRNTQKSPNLGARFGQDIEPQVTTSSMSRSPARSRQAGSPVP